MDRQLWMVVGVMVLLGVAAGLGVAGPECQRTAMTQPSSRSTTQPTTRAVGVVVRGVQRKADRVSVVRREEVVYVTVRSSRGIGWVVLECADGKWPTRIHVRFVYANGRAFKQMEGFSAVLQDGKGRRRELPDGKYDPARVTRDLVIPAETKLTRLKISWVDAYR